jgi:hypothetical protein
MAPYHVCRSIDAFTRETQGSTRLLNAATPLSPRLSSAETLFNRIGNGIETGSHHCARYRQFDTKNRHRGTKVVMAPGPV